MNVCGCKRCCRRLSHGKMIPDLHMITIPYPQATHKVKNCMPNATQAVRISDILHRRDRNTVQNMQTPSKTSADVRAKDRSQSLTDLQAYVYRLPHVRRFA